MIYTLESKIAKIWYSHQNFIASLTLWYNLNSHYRNHDDEEDVYFDSDSEHEGESSNEEIDNQRLESEIGNSTILRLIFHIESHANLRIETDEVQQLAKDKIKELK